MSDAAHALPRLFEGLDASSARRLVHAWRPFEAQAGQTILVEGDRPTALYFVERGLVRLVQLSTEGRVFVLGYVGPGECLNLGSAFEEGPLPATLEALVPTRLLLLPAEHWRGILRAHPEVCRAAALQLARELRVLSALVRELALHPVGARLARFLLEQPDGATAQGQRWTQEAIAASIGSVRDVVGRTLRGFIEAGILRKERGQLLIADRAELERVAQGE